MFLYCAVILALLIKDNAATLLVSEDPDVDNNVPQPLSLGDLAQLIQRVADEGQEENKGTERQEIDLDYFSTDDTHRTVLSSIVKLLKKNQPSSPNQNQQEDLGVRIHVIKNPQVLEEYKKSLRRRPHTHSTTESPSDQDDDSLSDLSSLAAADYADKDYNEGVWRRKNVWRRNAVFRLDDRSDDGKHSFERNKRESPNPSISSENDEVIHFETKSENKRDDKHESKNYESKTVEKDHHNRGDNDKEWDIITKKWDTTERRDRADDRFSREVKKRASDEDRNQAKIKPTKMKWNEDKKDVEIAKSIRETMGNDKSKKEDYKIKVDWKIKDSFKHKDKDDFKEKYDRETTYGIPTYRTTKDRGNRASPKKSYVPKISDYYQPQRPRNHDAGNSFNKGFGRTSIPFVGKKGIYEE